MNLCPSPHLYPHFCSKEVLRSEDEPLSFFLFHYRKLIEKKVNIKIKKLGSVWDLFLKSVYSCITLYIWSSVWNSGFLLRLFRENDGDSQPLELTHSQIAGTWQITEVEPIPGFIGLDLRLLLYHPSAKVHCAWWSGSDLCEIQELGECTHFSGKQTSVKRDSFGFCCRKPQSSNHKLFSSLWFNSFAKKNSLNHLYSYIMDTGHA